jgi:hypothetical protein
MTIKKKTTKKKTTKKRRTSKRSDGGQIDSVIALLARATSNSATAEDAVRYSQAAVNAANALCALASAFVMGAA